MECVRGVFMHLPAEYLTKFVFRGQLALGTIQELRSI